MKISRTYTALPAAMVLVAASVAIAGIASTGAPESSTGAPGERTCAVSGCHDDHILNMGPAQVSVQVGNGSGTYQPGKTYPVTVRVQQDGIKRFGYQATALGNDGSNAGSFQITDPARTQLQKSEVLAPGRTYMTYTYEGTSTQTIGWSEWTFNWTAPQADQGTVRLYVGAIAGDDSGTDKGDMAYTRTIELTPAQSSGIEYARETKSLQLDLR